MSKAKKLRKELASIEKKIEDGDLSPALFERRMEIEGELNDIDEEQQEEVD